MEHAPLHKIKEALERLRKETGFGEKDEAEETLQANSRGDRPAQHPGRVDDVQTFNGIGPLQDF